MKTIKSILIPVDFSMNTSVAISKVLDFCQHEKRAMMIHLYHVQQIRLTGTSHLLASFFSGYSRQQVNMDIEESRIRLEHLKSSMEKQAKNINVACWVSFGGPVEESIVKKAKELSVDLIIIGKSSHHSVFPFLNTVVPSRLASGSGISVLTVKPGSLNQDIKTIVIPIGHNFPSNKLEILDTLKSRSGFSVRLVVFGNNGEASPASRQLLFDVFRALKGKYPNSINYEVIKGRNKPKALLKYCQKVGADVLIVYPGAETRIGKWFNGQISDLFPAGSKTQVLAVMPN